MIFFIGPSWEAHELQLLIHPDTQKPLTVHKEAKTFRRAPLASRSLGYNKSNSRIWFLLIQVVNVTIVYVQVFLSLKSLALFGDLRLEKRAPESCLRLSWEDILGGTDFQGPTAQSRLRCSGSKWCHHYHKGSRTRVHALNSNLQTAEKCRHLRFFISVVAVLALALICLQYTWLFNPNMSALCASGFGLNPLLRYECLGYKVLL